MHYVFTTLIPNIIAVLIMGIAPIAVLVMLYLCSESFRDLVHDFEMWAANLRLKKRMKHNKTYEYLAPYEDVDPQVHLLLFEQDKQFPTIFEAVAADHNLSVKDILKTKTSQDAKDRSIIERATEYHNGIIG